MTTSALRWGTTCGLYLDVPPGDRIEPDSFVVTTGGSAYQVLTARRQNGRHPNRWSMRVVRMNPDDVPADADVFHMRWYPR